MKTLVIIPAYNEEESILDVVRTVTEAGYDYVVVNDGSSDATLEICREHRLNHINLFFNLGIGGAVQAGHQYAWRHGYDVDVQFDGDGQHDIAYIPTLLREIEQGYDLVIGSRFVSPSDGFQSSRLRRLGIRWLERCIRMVTGMTVTDATSGFRASGRRAMGLFAERYPIDYPEPESIVAAYNAGLNICEAPVSMRERQGGASSINLWKGAYYMVKVTLAVLIEGRAGAKRWG